MPHLFQPESAEELAVVARLSLQCVDRLMASMPPHEGIPCQEMSALVRLHRAALNHASDANRPPALES